MVKINGIDCDVEGKTLSEYLAEAEYTLASIVVERNEEIVPKTCYDKTILEDGDEIEIVKFMGGG